MWNPDLIISTSLLLLAVLLLRQPVAKYFGPKAAYLLWLAPGLRMLTPTLPALFSLQKDSTDSIEPTVTVPQMTPVPLEENFSELVQQYTLEPEAPFSLSEFLPWIWLAGFTLCLTIMVIRQVRFHSALTSLNDKAVRQLIDQRASGLGLLSPYILTGIDTPMTTGLLSPAIILPENFIAQYTAAEQRYIVDHELLHIHRKDIWAKAAALLFCALNWFNPLAWYALARFEADQEAACDADLLARNTGSRKSYAELLFKVSHPQSHRTLLTLEAGGFLKNRLSQISRSALSRSRQKVGTVTALTMASALVLTTAQYAQAKTERSQNPELEFGFVRGFDELKIVNFISSDGPMSPEEERAWLENLNSSCPDFGKTLEKDGFKSLKFPRTIISLKVNQKTDDPMDNKNFRSFSCVTGPGANEVASYMAAIARAKESLPDDIRNDIPLALSAYSYLEDLERYPEYLTVPIYSENGQVGKRNLKSFRETRGIRTRLITFDAPVIPDGSTLILAKNDRQNLDFEHLRTPTNDPVTIKDCGDKMEITWWVVKKPEGKFDIRQELCVDSTTFADKTKLKDFMLEDIRSMGTAPTMTPEYRSLILEQLKTKANSL